MPQQRNPGGERAGTAAGVYLLFDAHCRPDRDAICAALESLPLVGITHDPTEAPHPAAATTEAAKQQEARWLELILSGMTFDLLGLAPGPAVEKPAITHRYGCADDLEGKEALALVPGPHLSDGANSLPIVRAMLDLACGLARQLDGAETICWSPARSAVATTMLCQSVDRWIGGGPFPAMGLTGFTAREDGRLTSVGLDYFVGQELAFAPSLARDKVAATKLGARLVHEIVGSGRIEQERHHRFEDGLTVLLSPRSDSRIIEVTRM